MAIYCFPMPTCCSAHLPFTLYSREVSAAAGGKRGGAGLEPPTCQVGATDADLAALSIDIATTTLSTIPPAGWRCEAAHGQHPKNVYPMCHLFQKATPPRVGKATYRHIPCVFYPLRIWRRWMGRGLGMTSPLRSFRRRPLSTINPPPPPPPPPPPAWPSMPMVRGTGRGSAAADASAARLPARTVRRSWRYLGSTRPVYRP